MAKQSKEDKIKHIASIENSTQSGIDSQILGRVQEMNKVWAKVVSNGKVVVVRTAKDLKGALEYEEFSYRDFKEAVADEPEVIIEKTDKGVKKEPIGKVWFEHKEATKYDRGFSFDPAMKPSDEKLNLYRGLTVEPIYGDDEKSEVLRLYLNFVFGVICDGCKEKYRYLISKLAWEHQNPDKKSGVAIYLRSPQGAGKGTFMKPFAEIHKNHYFHAQSAGQVTGNFNAHLSRATMIFADEVFVGDKKSADKLKTIITEDTVVIESKGKNAVEIPSYCMLVMATNRKNALNLDKSERRYFVLEVGDSVKGNIEYFNKLNESFNAPEFHERLLGFLMGLNVGEFNPREAMKTPEFYEMAEVSRDELTAWMEDCIELGTMAGRQDHAGLNFFGGFVKSSDIEAGFRSWLRSTGRSGYDVTARKIGQFIKGLGGRSHKVSNERGWKIPERHSVMEVINYQSCD